MENNAKHATPLDISQIKMVLVNVLVDIILMIELALLALIVLLIANLVAMMDRLVINALDQLN